MKNNTIKDYVNSISKTLDTTAENNAVNNGYNDDGFTLILDNNKIKEGLNKERLRNETTNSLQKEFISKGYDVEKKETGLEIHVPSLLEEKESYTLDEIEQRNRIEEKIKDKKTEMLLNSLRG